ncbi:hypothetical protein [Phenylobacterium sp.]|uniref:hypothetical protein n=1 Tax=Phenylobacterium sp. TaxID=1871053 RepID=UPI002F3EE08B
MEIYPTGSYGIDVVVEDQQCMLCENVYTDYGATPTDVVGGRGKLQLKTEFR